MIEAMKKIHAALDLRWKKLGKAYGVAELVKWELERHIDFDGNAPTPQQVPQAALLEAADLLEDWGNMELNEKFGLNSYATIPDEAEAILYARMALCYSVIRGDAGFEYAKVSGDGVGKYPEWVDGFCTESEAWAAVAVAIDCERLPLGIQDRVAMQCPAPRM